MDGRREEMMKMSARGTAAFALVWLALAGAFVALQTRPWAKPLENGQNDRVFSGRVIDGLGRPVPGMKVTVSSDPDHQETAPAMVLRTDDDGRYAGILPPGDQTFWIVIEKAGYGTQLLTPEADEAVTMRRDFDWEEASSLLYNDDTLDLGVRELLASDEWERRDSKLLDFLFWNQDHFRPALRRLISDTHVGASARDWLELLDDPGDRDLFANKRKYAPKKEVKETDLIDALKETALQRNFFSSAPKPEISIDSISFSKNLDNALICCGINMAPLTGVMWQFVFWKVGNQWELYSAKEAGRG